MDANTLVKICSVSGHHVEYDEKEDLLHFDPQYDGPTFQASRWMNSLESSMDLAHCKTVNRAAMWFAQLGEESGSFRYTQELASGAEYNGWTSLGNVEPGDGERFKGRTYIQITGRHNYTALSAWAFSVGRVPTYDYFVQYPEKLAQVDYIFLGPVWYWTVARHMNPYADRNDIVGATRAVNGGLNGLSDREERYNVAKSMGKLILPYHKPSPHPKPPVVTIKHKNHKHHEKHPEPTKLYVVRDGDTLSKIAEREDTTWQMLQKLNNLKDANLIFVGQTLRIG